MARDETVIGSAKNEQIQAGDARAQWERPALRRLTTSEAEVTHTHTKDNKSLS
jgi:hypothetical protein